MSEKGDLGQKITFLGCGPSSGVPGIGIGWGACNPDNPKNERSRQSLLVETGRKRLLIDTTPDLRTQLLRAGVHELDAVLYTHAHADHMNGLDDLRGINKAIQQPLPVYADADTHDSIRTRFTYALEPLPPEKSTHFYRPVLQMTEFVPGDEIAPVGVSVGTFIQDHGFSTTVGFSFGRTVYSTDVKSLSEDVLDDLAAKNLDVWIIGVFQWKTHWTHCHVDQALDWIARVKPRRAILTHLGTGIDYDDLNAATPDYVVPAFDQMTVEIDQPGGDIRIGS